MTSSTVSTDAADWILCGDCEIPVFRPQQERNLWVCPHCERHGGVTAAHRLEQLTDPGSMTLLDLRAPDGDPLGFVDTQPYPARVAQARARTGLPEAVVCAKAEIHGSPVILAVMDFRFLGGSLGCAVGELITAAIETARADRVPIVIVTASGGARMQEGALSLMQMAKTSAALEELDRAGVLSISVITDPTFGGVAASFATLPDVIIAEPAARLGFAGRRVIEQTIGEQLPPDFQTAEFLAERGFIDMVVPRRRLRDELGKLVRFGVAAAREQSTPTDRPSSGPLPVTDPAQLGEPDPWRQVGRARDLARPTGADYLALAFEDFRELHGDRLGGDGAAIIGGIAWLGGRPVIAIVTQKGHEAAELTGRNFGMATPADYRKAARLMRLANKLGVPVITLVDTPGAYPGADAEWQGQAIAIAENLRLMAGLTVPVLSVITGEGGSGGALALAMANRVLMFTDAVYSVISPEGCAAIVWKDSAAAPEAAAALRLNSRDLLRFGVVDGVIAEPDGGVGVDPELAALRLRAALVHTLDELTTLDPDQLRQDRFLRYRRFGTTGEVAQDESDR